MARKHQVPFMSKENNEHTVKRSKHGNRHLKISFWKTCKPSRKQKPLAVFKTILKLKNERWSLGHVS